MLISSKCEPKSYKLAKDDINWQNAMEAEINALNLNNTWKIVTLPPGKIPIGC